MNAAPRLGYFHCFTPRLLSVFCVVFLFITALLALRMHLKPYFAAALTGLPLLAQAAPASSASDSSEDGHFTSYTISAEGITVKAIPYGARLTSVLVNDRHGRVQDVLTGYDDPIEYLHDTETNHTYFGATVGRYANRIKNGTFTIDGNTYHIPENEHNGEDTLHGGFIGYDQRNWTVGPHTDSSITFSLLDEGFQNFPGDVLTTVTFTVDKEVTAENPKGLPQLTSRIVSEALTKKTPIMLANHLYWNLNAFKNENVLKDTTMQMPLSTRYIGADGIEVPTGEIYEVSNTYGGALDFTKPKLIGKDIEKTKNLCGTGCTGYDTCWITDRDPGYSAPNSMVSSITLASDTTGISLDVTTNQAALQIYTCNSQNGSIKTKKSQQERNKKQDGSPGAEYVEKYGCVVIETEDWIDGINQPEWGRDAYQIFGPADPPAMNWAVYQFSTF